MQRTATVVQLELGNMAGIKYIIKINKKIERLTLLLTAEKRFRRYKMYKLNNVFSSVMKMSACLPLPSTLFLLLSALPIMDNYMQIT